VTPLVGNEGSDVALAPKPNFRSLGPQNIFLDSVTLPAAKALTPLAALLLPFGHQAPAARCAFPAALDIRVCGALGEFLGLFGAAQIILDLVGRHFAPVDAGAGAIAAAGVLAALDAAVGMTDDMYQPSARTSTITSVIPIMMLRWLVSMVVPSFAKRRKKEELELDVLVLA
jgi:hypothetical protein